MKLKNIKKQSKYIAIVVVFSFLPFVSYAEIPNQINYQGKLRDTGGNPITALTTIQFSLYSHITNGSPSDVPGSAGPLLWTETYDGSGGCAQITPDSDGIFAQHLGSCVPFPSYLDFTDGYYLGVKIGADAEATPRVPFATNPYAFTSKSVHTENEDVNIDTETSGNIVLNSAGNIQLQANDVTSAFIVDQQGTGNLFELQRGGITLFIVQNNGFVGIGVGAPTAQLHVAGDMRLEGALYDFNNETGVSGQILSSTVNGVDWVDATTTPWDNDHDTGIQVEEAADDDTIRFDTFGTQRAKIDNIGNVLFSNLDSVDLLNPGALTGLLFRNDKHALRLGEAGNNEWDDANIGNGSFASGRNNIVSGNYSTAFGGNNNVNDVYATALGRNNTVTGSYAVAGGYQNTAGGYASSVFGQTNQATDRRAMAWGLDNIASQDEATAWGRNTRASANYATSWGRDTQASGNYSTAFGYQNTASQDYGLAFGYRNTVGGRYATGWGGQNTVSGQYGTAWGSHNTASGAHSTAFGYYSEASAENGTAIGDSLANSNYMTAIGRFNENVAGQSLTNWVDTDQLFVIGNGSGWQNANRSNALTILKNGTITAPTFSLAEINAAGATALTTKEYVDGRVGTSIFDADADTGIQVEATPDEDMVRLSTAGTERFLIDTDGRMRLSDDPAATARYSLFEVGGNTYSSSTFAVKANSSYNNIATFRDSDGENIFLVKGAMVNNDFHVSFGDFTDAYGAVSMTIKQSDNSVSIESGNLRLLEGHDSINAVGFKSPSGVVAEQIWTLPGVDGAANEVLYTNGAGVLGWKTATNNNIYNTNGTLTGDRIVTSNGNSLEFTGTNNSYSFAASDGASNNTVFNIGDDEVEIASSDGASGSSMVYNPGLFQLSTTSAGGSLGLTLGANMMISDSLNSRGVEYDADYSANYTNRTLVDKEYVDDQLMWEILPANTGGMRIQPKNNSVRQIFVQRDDNSYTQFKVRNNNDAGNGAGAIIELKGSGADYTNNMYIGKYGASFWIPELRDNGAVLTDKNLVIGTASAANEIHFVTGNSYTDLQPVVVADNEGFRYTSDLSATFVDRTLVDKAYVDDAIIAVSSTASNGLTKVGNDIQLGGTLTQNTMVNANGNRFTVENANLFGFHAGDLNDYSMLDMRQTTVDLKLEENGNIHNPSINLESGSLELNLGNDQAIELSTASMVVRDENNFQGLIYDADYSLAFVNRSLVDKEYVDNAVAGGGASPWTKTGTNLSPTTAGDDILLNAGETLSIADMTQGSIPFIGASGLVTQNNGNLFWDATNNRLGIGTTTPSVKLQVSGQARASSFRSANGTAGSPSYRFDGDTNTGLFRAAADNLAFTTGGSEAMRIDASNNLGIGITIPTAQLHTTGTVRFANFGAGTMQTDANGNVSVSSDERLKNIQGDFDRGLEDLLQLRPIEYKWKDSTGYDTENSYYGFSAQNVQMSIPEAVGEDNRGFLTLADRPILATVVNAIKEQQQQIDALGGHAMDSAQTIKTKLVDDVRNVLEEVVFNAEVEFEKTTTFFADAIFTDKVTFMDRVTFVDKDMAGTAIIEKGDDEIKVKFDKDFVFTPFVTATVNNAFVLYKVTDVTESSFKIKIQEEATKDIQFTWQAITVGDTDNEIIDDGDETILENTDTVSNDDANNENTDVIVSSDDTNVQDDDIEEPPTQNNQEDDANIATDDTQSGTQEE